MLDELAEVDLAPNARARVLLEGEVADRHDGPAENLEREAGGEAEDRRLPLSRGVAHDPLGLLRRDERQLVAALSFEALAVHEVLKVVYKVAARAAEDEVVRAARREQLRVVERVDDRLRLQPADVGTRARGSFSFMRGTERNSKRSRRHGGTCASIDPRSAPLFSAKTTPTLDAVAQRRTVCSYISRRSVVLRCWFLRPRRARLTKACTAAVIITKIRGRAGAHHSASTGFAHGSSAIAAGSISFVSRVRPRVLLALQWRVLESRLNSGAS